MLNQALVDQFRSVHDEQRTGALVVQQRESQLRFYFENGDLLLLDYGIDKELLLLRQYRAYHKIGYEIEAMVEQKLRAGERLRTKDYLLQQQLVTQEETEQVTRTLVEDTLCDVFGGESQRIFWDEGADPESFDLERTAVKLRIQVPLLLTMVEGRVQERDAVRREVPDYQAVYSLVEGASSPDALNDMELNSLHFIDGRKTVEDIAAGIRDSSLNTACYIVSLVNQGFIGRSRAGSGTVASGRIDVPNEHRQQVATEPEPAITSDEQATMPAQMGPPPGTPPVAQSEVVIREEQPRGSRAPMILLLSVVLAVMVWVGYLVMESQRRQQVIDDLRDGVHGSIRGGDWAAAQNLLIQAREQAGTDSVLQGKLDDLVAGENEQFATQLEDLEQAIEADEIAEALSLAEELPADPLAYDKLWLEQPSQRLMQLRSRLEERRRELEDEARLFRRQVQNRLDGGSVDVALEMIEEAHPMLSEAGDLVLREWRVNLLTDATDSTRSIGERERLLEQVARANPSEDNLETLDQIQSDIDRVRAVVAAAIGTMQRELAAGDFALVLEKADENVRLATGSELAGTISALRQQAQELRDQLDQLVARAALLVRTSREPEEIAAVASELGARIEEMPQAANIDAMRRASAIAQAVVDSLRRETTGEEISALGVIEIDQEAEDGRLAVEDALLFRRQELSTREERARRDVERAHEEFTRGSLDQAEAAFQAILDREDYRRTAAHAQAVEGLERVQAERVMRQARFGALREAMLADDIDAVTRMSREMALPRLPMLVRTRPAGAEVSVGGEVVGTTPFILEDLSAERVDQQLTVSLDGYRSVEVDPAEASGGWRIAFDLIRAPDRSFELGDTVTSEPAVIDGRLWLVGKRQVFAIGEDGIERHGLDGSGGIGRSLVDPVYAPVCVQRGSIYVTTRDRIALRIGGGGVTRLPLAAESDLPLASYASPYVNDREVLVVAGRNGRLAASDNLESPQLWRGPQGAPFAVAPLVIGDGVLSLRQDGSGQITACDTGAVIESVELGGNVVAAWREEDAIVGYLGDRRFRWAGGTPTLGDPLGRSVTAAAPGVVVTGGREVHLVAEDGTLRSIGTYPANLKPLAAPVRWGDHVAITGRGEILVVGERQFSLKVEGDVLRPAVLDGQLVVGEVNGRVRFYAP